MGLICTITMSVYDNVTNWETLNYEGRIVRRLPLCGLNEKYRNVKPNPWDLMWINNLEMVFGKYMVYWWFPLGKIEMEGGGFWFGQIPKAFSHDIGIL